MNTLDTTEKFLNSFEEFKKKYSLKTTGASTVPAEVTTLQYLELCKRIEEFIDKDADKTVTRKMKFWRDITAIVVSLLIWLLCLFIAIIVFASAPKCGGSSYICTAVFASLLIICPTVLLGFAVKFYCNKED